MSTATGAWKRRWPAGLLVATLLGGALWLLGCRVGPAWYYRLKYHAARQSGPDKVAAARRTVRANPFFATDYAVLFNLELPAATCRLGLYELGSGRCLVHTRAMHGRGSGTQLARHFSNQAGSGQTALGRYVIVDVYHGRFGQAYRLAGLDATNSQALTRSIVLHSSAYVRAGHMGRSEGCPAVSDSALLAMRPYLGVGTLVWLYR